MNSARNRLQKFAVLNVTFHTGVEVDAQMIRMMHDQTARLQPFNVAAQAVLPAQRDDPYYYAANVFPFSS